jgi:hypothetical protein
MYIIIYKLYRLKLTAKAEEGTYNKHIYIYIYIIIYKLYRLNLTAKAEEGTEEESMGEVTVDTFEVEAETGTWKPIVTRFGRKGSSALLPMGIAWLPEGPDWDRRGEEEPEFE